MERNFRAMLKKQWEQGHFLCVGLDPVLAKIPDSIVIVDNDPHRKIFCFLWEIINAVKDFAGAWKPNLAFFGRHGIAGWLALEQTLQHIRTVSAAPIILDGKRTDIGSTNEAYAYELFDWLDADAITVNPYFGGGSLEPFLKRKDKGVFVLCRTTGANSGEFQDIEVNDPILGRVPFYQIVARHVSEDWDKNQNCGLVVGATHINELKAVRDIVGDMLFLIPGIGKQGGEVAATVKAAQDSHGRGFIINSSRDILYASAGSDFAEAAAAKAQEIHKAILQSLAKVT